MIPPNEARILMCHALRMPHATLAAHPELPLDRGCLERFEEWVGRRALGEPIAYLVGEREFYGRRFRVTPDVLIPRSETELLVDLARNHLAPCTAPRVLDLGTGSGVLAVTLALELRSASVSATDVSRAALAVARANALAHGAAVRFFLCDWYSGLPRENFDLIVSNPPYVTRGDPHLCAGDPRFEPRQALDGGADGLAALRAIIDGARDDLSPGGWLLVEHGYDQAEQVRRLFGAAGLNEVESWRDLAGIERVTGGRK